MNKSEGGKYFIQWETHPKQGFKGLCMLLERQCLVDVAICCGSNTVHAHKCVLAANSSYFKENFESGAVEQVIINGVDYAVMKSIIEFMYCGETVFAKEHMKYFIAVVKLFKLSALENILAENDYHNIAVDDICIPPPQFICKPPKYPTVFKPFGSSSGSNNGNIVNGSPSSSPSCLLPPPPSLLASKLNSAYALNSLQNLTSSSMNNSSLLYNPATSMQQHHKFNKRKTLLGSEAEKACAKEAQASRIALANLRKVMASTPQLHSFIVEESFNETTVENFIPNVEDPAHGYSNSSTNNGNVGDSLEPPQLSLADPGAHQSSALGSLNKSLNMIPLTLSTAGNTGQGLTADKIKHILGNEDVEIMFQTSDGSFVNVSDEVLLNLSKGGLQYQVVDENGQVGEIRELKSLDTDNDSTLDKIDTGSSLTDDPPPLVPLTTANTTVSLSLEEISPLTVPATMTDDSCQIDGDSSKGEQRRPETLSDGCQNNPASEASFETIQAPAFATSNTTISISEFRSKSPLVSLPAGSFNDNLYETSFAMHNSEIFEPENLSMQFTLMDDTLMTVDHHRHSLVKYSDGLGDGNNNDQSDDKNVTSVPMELEPPNEEIITFNKDSLVNDMIRSSSDRAKEQREQGCHDDQILTLDPSDSKPKPALTFAPDMFFGDFSSIGENNVDEDRAVRSIELE